MIFSLWNRVCQWFDAIEIHDPKLAQLLCKAIPATCPFEQDIKLFNRTLFHLPHGSLREESISPHLPPLCKLNPLYEQVVSLRFKALSYLADECGEDIAIYC